MKIVDVYDVFTPTTPARLTFVEREIILKKINNAIRTPGKQMIVYGNSGGGKTTLLENKLHQLYESHITSRCMKGITVNELMLNAFDQLSRYYVSEETQSTKLTVKASLKQDYLTIKSSIEASSENNTQTKKQRILPPQLTAQSLAKFLGECNSCWVIEDFHKVENDEKNKLSQLMKVFMDEADTYRTVKIIAIGAVDTARQIVEYDHEMRNRVAEIHVPLMSDKEILEIINKGLSLLNLKMSSKNKNEITKYSNGLASVCHHLCLNACIDLNVYETVRETILITNSNLQEAVKSYLEEMSDSIKNSFERIFKQERESKYKNAELIIEALSVLEQDGATRAEIYKTILKKEENYPQGNLTNFLSKLISDKDSIVQLNPNSGKYSFKDPIYKAAALIWFSKTETSYDIDIDIGIKIPFIDAKFLRETLNKNIQILRRDIEIRLRDQE